MASPAGGGGTREFFAVRAARWLGAAAQKAGGAIARAVVGQSAKALRAEAEARASGPQEALGPAVAEWARLLGAPDDTPRYEDPDGGPTLTFRAAFLSSQAFELALASVAAAAIARQAGGAATGSFRAGNQAGATDAAPKLPAGLGDAAWRSFLRGTTVPGGDELAAQLPELLARARHFPDCRQRIEEAVNAVKADAQLEVLKSKCTLAGTRAEEIRTSLRASRRASVGGGGGAQAGPGAPNLEELRKSSAEAVRLYAAFRSGLAESAAHLRQVSAERTSRLKATQEALLRLQAEAAEREAAATARHTELDRERGEAVAAPRRVMEELERDGQRLQTDAKAGAMEAQKKQLQIELDKVSEALASKRKEHVALQEQRSKFVEEHGQRTKAIELQLQELRPATFHNVVTPRTDALTEGEVVASLARSAEGISSLASRAGEALAAAAARRNEELDGQLRAIVSKAPERFRQHSKLELERLEAAGATVADAVSALVDFAKSRADLIAMGLPPDAYGAGSVPPKKDVRPAWAPGSRASSTTGPLGMRRAAGVRRRLQRGLSAARRSWEEAIEALGLWTAEGEQGAFSAVVPQEHIDVMLQDLEAARSRISQCLVPLQRIDPGLYDMVVLGEDEEADVIAEVAAASAASQLPHGWEEHTTPEGAAYFHNLVSRETQWEEPTQDAAVSAGWRLCQADTGAWFYHNPYDGQGVWWPELPTYVARPETLDDLRQGAG